ncbi:MAG: hypothetical protein D5R99_08480 [Methanocalculus sp. MSAO_Arc1]|uniref:hypothetical protein n=1 Tax=Methanocalculus TaxID=71151 RepID=UPI000FF45904|nr:MULTISPECIES: hypothetical protein [unclassified Methanocalculus]MCP1663136.1 hypothetical protein [Methanocalculus sp. AMF5]RQD79345.1 MAG: hypothetical protein D5R99_08480 [Methanocalculus sp. MSAO_Arc1]
MEHHRDHDKDLRKGSLRIIGCVLRPEGGFGGYVLVPVESRPPDLPYEMIETENRIYITASLPADDLLTSAPYARIERDRVALVVNEHETWIVLPAEIRVVHSTYTIRNGVIDIFCRKPIGFHPIRYFSH